MTQPNETHATTLVHECMGKRGRSRGGAQTTQYGKGGGAHLSEVPSLTPAMWYHELATATC